MTDNGDEPRREDGFEYQSRFYRWRVTDMGKDLMLIDRFSGLPVVDFFNQIEDTFDRGRAPVLLSLIATSIRAGNPDWTVERIVRLVMDMNLADVTFVDADKEEQPDSPPAPAAPEAATTGEPSSSPPVDSSSSPTPEANGSSETSFAIPA